MRRLRWMPITRKGLRAYDDRPPLEAAALAWSVAGRVPHAHTDAQDVVRRAMPLLARALDRETYGRALPDARYGSIVG